MDTEPYSLPESGDDQPKAIYQRLVDTMPEFEDQKTHEPSVEFLMRNFDLVEGGRVVLGAVHLPKVQGKLKGVFEWMIERTFGYMPTFLIVLDTHYWQSVGPREREILIFHEACHMGLKRDKYGEVQEDEDGRPRWGLVGHDVEEFTAVVARYGAWNGELEGFILAAQNHAPGT